MTAGEAHGAGRWPPIPAVLRVMTGWFFTGIGALNLAVEMDGGLTPPYLVFHVVLFCGGLLLLTGRPPALSRTGLLLAALLMGGGLGLGRLAGSGYPYPFTEVKWLVADVIFWGCAALILGAVVGAVERRLPERRVPVDLSGYSGRAGENVGGLT
jgi:hypothetical protein